MMKTSRMIKSAFITAASSVLFLLAGCGSETKEETLSETLKTPEAKVSEVTVSGFRVDWSKVYGAENYTYSLDGAEADSTKDLSVTFNGLEASKEYVVRLQAEPAKGSTRTSSCLLYTSPSPRDCS